MSDPIRNAVGTVLTNAANFPDRVQSRLLGQDMGPLIDRVTEAVASVLAEQGEPEWEYMCDGKDRHGSGIRRFTDSPDEVERLAGRGYVVQRRTKAIPAGPWLPVEENGETMTACCTTSEPCEKHQDARHQELPESTDGSERLGVVMPDEEFVLARPWRSGAHVRIEWPVIRNACGYCGWEHPPRDHSMDANRTIGPNGPTMPAPVFETSRTNQTTPNRTVGPDPLDCPACGYDPMAPHNGKGDCAADRKTGCRDCGCPDRSDDHLREEWSCGCRCHTDRTDGSGDAQA